LSDGVAEGDRKCVGGVQAARQVGSAKLEAEHFTDLTLVTLPVSGNRGLDAGGWVMVDGEASEGGSEHGDRPGLADRHGRAYVLTHEGLLDGDDGRLVTGDDVAELGEDVLEALLDGPRGLRGDDVAGDGARFTAD
jgi:hypothetical protein